VGEGEEVAERMYTHVSKCKNNKIKEKESFLFYFKKNFVIQ
jgi:hypothetical protein